MPFREAAASQFPQDADLAGVDAFQQIASPPSQASCRHSVRGADVSRPRPLSNGDSGVSGALHLVDPSTGGRGSLTGSPWHDGGRMDPSRRDAPPHNEGVDALGGEQGSNGVVIEEWRQELWQRDIAVIPHALVRVG